MKETNVKKQAINALASTKFVSGILEKLNLILVKLGFLLELIFATAPAASKMRLASKNNHFALLV